MFRAFDDAQGRVAACKVVNLFISPSLGHGTPNVKELQKEVQVHKALKNQYILEFIHSEIVDRDQEGQGWVPGLYMLLELAVGGDLFDKIGTSSGSDLHHGHWKGAMLIRDQHRTWVYQRNWQSSTLPKCALAS